MIYYYGKLYFLVLKILIFEIISNKFFIIYFYFQSNLMNFIILL